MLPSDTLLDGDGIAAAMQSIPTPSVTGGEGSTRRCTFTNLGVHRGKFSQIPLMLGGHQRLRPCPPAREGGGAFGPPGRKSKT